MKVVNSNDENASIKIMNTNSESEIISSTFGPLFSSWGNVSEQPYTLIILNKESVKIYSHSSINNSNINLTPAAIATQSEPSGVTFSHNPFASRSKTLMALHYMRMKHARRSGGLQQEYHEM
jgi:hypothetical protein